MNDRALSNRRESQLYPLWVTRTCLSPNFLNISMTVSIGVWSVTVMGARSKLRRNLTGDEAEGFPCTNPLKITSESSLMSSCLRRTLPKQLTNFVFFSSSDEKVKDQKFKFNLPIANMRSRLNTQPTKKWDSREITTGKALCLEFSKMLSTSLSVIESWVRTVSGAFPLKNIKHNTRQRNKSVSTF